MITYLRADIHRYVKVGNHISLLSKMKMLILHEPMWYLIIYRAGSYVKDHVKIPVIKQLLYIILYILHKFFSVVMGIQIPLGTKIGKGVYLPHYGTIVVHQDTIIGENCNIGQGVTIGIAGRGEKKGVPQIGNKVYIAPGAKIIGKIVIGNNVMIGANSVVTKDVPDNAVVAGVPAKIISYKGWE
ncbi:serine O-acetyltransferase [Paenibacillus plantarum]|nr:DapH/DapD/GlmU-related protein [Paenibacillus plantarum]